MSPDPGTDRQLDADMVRSVLREQFPELAEERIVYLDEGYDFQMYEAGDEWLFRFPKRAEVVPWFLRELAIMPAIEVTIGVPVPRFEKIGEAGNVFPYPFAGYRRLPGVDADDVESLDRSAVARSLGFALTRLHSLDASLIPPAPEVEERDDQTGQRVIDDVLNQIPEAIRDEAAAYLRGELVCPPFPGPARVAHNDLLPEHVLIDPSTGRLAGIIDFADLAIGDPAGDFAGLLSIGGREFVREVIGNYAMPVDDPFLDRVRWRTRNLHLSQLVDAVATGSDVTDSRRLVALAFADRLPRSGA